MYMYLHMYMFMCMCIHVPCLEFVRGACAAAVPKRFSHTMPAERDRKGTLLTPSEAKIMHMTSPGRHTNFGRNSLPL